MAVGVGVVGVGVESVSGLFGVGQVVFVDYAFDTACQCGAGLGWVGRLGGVGEVLRCSRHVIVYFKQ